LALARLHRVLDVGAHVEITLAAELDPARAASAPAEAGPGPHRPRGWREAELIPLLEAAGFGSTAVAPGNRCHVARARRLRSLPDIVGPDMRLLVCGLNPSVYAADRGVNYARPGNRFWPAALAAGLVTVERDPWHALEVHGVGFSDLVKRATVGAAELSAAEYRHGAGRLRWTVRLLRPAALCCVGLAGWRAAVDVGAVAGAQPDPFAGVPAYVMPNTSGLNARSSPADFEAHLRAAAALGGGWAGGRDETCRPLIRASDQGSPGM